MTFAWYDPILIVIALGIVAWTLVENTVRGRQTTSGKVGRAIRRAGWRFIYPPCR